ncbi:LuxR C-terminal-related transcriptional regulator [Microbacterium sp.]|uniref:helix-turn-helix transcriptional regulator n=1 Tax=Microbacterium sp. TaxID=51671 RepID=UPI003F953FEC
MKTAQQEHLPAQPTAIGVRQRVPTVVSELFATGRPTAPHVVAKLLRRLNGDALTVHEVAAELTDAQRAGQRMLPRLLPLVPSISRSFDSLELDDDDRRVLLLAALRTDDDLDLLLTASQRTARALATGPLGTHLRISNGHCRFADERMAIWLERTAPAPDLISAHARLHRAHRQHDAEQHDAELRGSRPYRASVSAAWHLACGAFERTPAVAPALIAAARELSDSGHTDRAFTVAAEAADHAEGADRDEARLIAGAAAVAAGCFEDAGDWLGGLFPHGDVAVRSRALASLLIAETCAHGMIPVIDPAEHRPRTADAQQWREWARTAGLAAVMCAERGAPTSMRMWLAELRDADARAEAGGTIREPAVTLCWILTGETDDDGDDAPGPFSGGVIGALRAAVGGDIEHGLLLLARTSSAYISETDPLMTGFERSPLMGAHLAVTEALLYFWRGDIGTARERLSSASVDLPIGVPFAGLGTVLARRLDINALGGTGALPQVLAATLPHGIRIDAIVDRGLSAYLGGAREQADAELALWHDRGAEEPALSLPGLDEVGPITDRRRVEPPEQRMTRELLVRIRRLPEASWRREHDDIAAAGRGLRSSFCRGRVEALLGSACVVHGDVLAGRRHLRAARSLFEDAGTPAWRDTVDDRIARLGAHLNARSQEPTAPIAIITDADPVENCRVAWSAVLRERELEVAMRVIEGLTNGEVATALGISVRTVEVHIGRVMSTFGVRNRVELTALAHRTARHL